MYDKDCFHLTWEDNLCYDEDFYRVHHDRLEKFVQYYESCKELKRNKHTEKCFHCGGTKSVHSLSTNAQIPCPKCCEQPTQNSEAKPKKSMTKKTSGKIAKYLFT